MKYTIWFFVFILVSCGEISKSESENQLLIDIQKNKIIDLEERLYVKQRICLKRKGRNDYIGRVDKVYINNKHIFVLDRFSDNNLFVFDIDGNYIKNLGNQLDGSPEGFFNMSDFVVDKESNQIKLIAKNKILNYDLVSLKFLNSFKIEHPIDRIQKIDNIYITKTISDNEITYFNESFQPIEDYVPNIPIFSTSPFLNFNKLDNGEVSFHRMHENMIYQFDKNGLKNKQSIIFTNANNFEGVNLEEAVFNPYEIQNRLSNEVYIKELFMTNQYYCFTIRDKGIPYMYFYNTKDQKKSFSHKYILKDGYKNNLTKDNMVPKIIGAKGEYLIASINEQYLDEKDDICDQEFDHIIILLGINNI